MTCGHPAQVIKRLQDSSCIWCQFSQEEKCIYKRTVSVHCVGISACLCIYSGMFMWTVFLLMPSYCLWARASVSPNCRSIFIWAFLQTTSLAWLRQNTDFHCTPIKSECLSCFSLVLHLHPTVHLYCAKAKERSLPVCCIVKYTPNTFLCLFSRRCQKFVPWTFQRMTQETDFGHWSWTLAMHHLTQVNELHCLSFLQFWEPWALSFLNHLWGIRSDITILPLIKFKRKTKNDVGVQWLV